MALGHLLAEGHDDGAAGARESVHNVSSQETGGTEDGRGMASQRAAAACNADYGLAGAGDGDVLLDATAGLDGERDGGFGEAIKQPGRGPSVGHCGVSGEVWQDCQWLAWLRCSESLYRCCGWRSQVACQPGKDRSCGAFRGETTTMDIYLSTCSLRCRK
jgi:hypothetical protein